jgi:hypothetical protein
LDLEEKVSGFSEKNKVREFSEKESGRFFRSFGIAETERWKDGDGETEIFILFLFLFYMFGGDRVL